MGMYTNYRLTVENVDGTPVTDVQRERIVMFAEMDDLDVIRAQVKYHSGEFCERKWYDHEADMQAFSEKFPEHRFTLTGICELGNIWALYAHAGRVEKHEAHITAQSPWWILDDEVWD